MSTAIDTDIRGKVAIVGVGHTPQGELPGQSPELNSVLAIKEALNDAGITSAILDRLLHGAESVVIEGKSYRTKDQADPTA